MACPIVVTFSILKGNELSEAVTILSAILAPRRSIIFLKIVLGPICVYQRTLLRLLNLNMVLPTTNKAVVMCERQYLYSLSLISFLTIFLRTTNFCILLKLIFNLDYKKLIIIGSAIECVHSYSLIHDDLPCMDNDKLRRGKPSTHIKFGESTAVLAGNSLLTMAFEILSNSNLKINDKTKVNLIKKISKCSGHLGIAGGQFLDLSF